MTDAKLIRVRVLPSRSLSLASGSGTSNHHVSGDELELPPDEAKQLIADGIVERAPET